MKLLEHIKHKLQGKLPNGAKRSDKWPAVRKRHLAQYPNCAVCGGVKRLEVHHMEPFHLNPSKELDPNNLITLCESKNNGVNCHLLIGHLGNFKSMNHKVMDDANVWQKKIKGRP
jgi:5-methylcytosine-specific restriction protein A